METKEGKKEYNLTKRASNFGRDTLLMLKSLPENTINRTLISQLARSSTSVCANYLEADGCSSKKDFKHKISICKREASESMHWFEMISTVNENIRPNCERLRGEAHELVLIFASILRS